MKKTAHVRYYTHPGSLSGLEEFARSRQKHLEPMLTRFGLTLDTLNDPQAIIPFASVCGVLEACAQQWQCPDLGIQLGRLQNLDFLGATGLVARLSDTVGEACQAIQTNMTIHSNAYYSGIELGNSVTGESACIDYAPRPGAGCGPQMVELSLCRIYQVLALTSGLKPLKIREVTFQHPAMGSSNAALQFFGCQVRYGMPRNALYFSPQLLDAPTVVRDNAYASIVQAYLQQERLQADSEIVLVTRRLVAQLLSTGRCTREKVAEFLHMHPRTLRRRLKEHGTSFADIRDDYSRARATEWVSARNFSLTQISLMLGYSNQNAFSVAFRRWAGMSPSEARRQIRS